MGKTNHLHDLAIAENNHIFARERHPAEVAVNKQKAPQSLTFPQSGLGQARCELS